MLINCGCDGIERLDIDPFEYLSEDFVQEQVLDSLGLEAQKALNNTLFDSCSTVKKIARNIAGLVPSATVGLSLLLSIHPGGEE